MSSRRYQLGAVLLSIVGAGWLAIASPTLAGTPIEGGMVTPSSGVPGITIGSNVDPCDFSQSSGFVHKGDDFAWFANFANPDHYKYLARALLGRGTPPNVRTLVVPRLPPGRYVLVAQCGTRPGTGGPSIEFAIFTILPDTDAAAPQVESDDRDTTAVIRFALVLSAAMSAARYGCGARCGSG